MADRITEIKHGRNYIRAGDLVRVRGVVPGRHDGFKARFKYAMDQPSGLTYVVVELEGGRPQRFRSVHATRVVRVARTHDPANF